MSGRLLLTCLLAVSGCGGKDRTPEGAVELFVLAAQAGDESEVYRLLAPVSQRELEEKARLANAQSTGRRFRPQDLLGVGRRAPREEVGYIRRLAVEGDRARVQIGNNRSKTVEVLELRKTGDGWRIVLPARRENLAPASAPASSPASHPAAGQP